MELTAKQRDVAVAVARGKSNIEVAAALGLSGDMVRQHLKFVYAALGIDGPSPARQLIARRAEFFPNEFGDSPHRRTWADEFREMGSMSVPERMERFRHLAAGRPLPVAFDAYSLPMRIEWLNREWPL